MAFFSVDVKFRELTSEKKRTTETILPIILENEKNIEKRIKEVVYAYKRIGMRHEKGDPFLVWLASYTCTYICILLYRLIV